MNKKTSKRIALIVISLIVVVLVFMYFGRGSSLSTFSGANCQDQIFPGSQGQHYLTYDAMRSGEHTQYTDAQLEVNGYSLHSDGVYAKICS